jgi:tRNA(adenine34) deaminase
VDASIASADIDRMRRCIALARVAGQRGDAPVGALVAQGNRMIAEAGERVDSALDVAGHAELEAIRLACRVLGGLELGDCVLYTSAEPCFMCAYAIRQTGIPRVVIGATTPAVGGVTSRYPILCAADVPGWTPPPVILQGVLVAECEALLGEG